MVTDIIPIGAGAVVRPCQRRRNTSRPAVLGISVAVRSCHEAVVSNLPAEASPEFKSTSSLKNTTQAHGGYLYVVSGDVRSLEIDGQVHDMTYRCEVHVDSSGTVHKATEGTTWK